MPASCRSDPSFALNHTGPTPVGTRSTVDHRSTCGCSIGPAGVSSSSASRSAIHVSASASHAGSVQRDWSTVSPPPRGAR